MLRTVKLSLTAVLALGSACVLGQSTLGALLDAGARKLTAEEFKTELVQRTLVGHTGTIIGVEVMYTSGGTITGMSLHSGFGPGGTLDGEWRIDSEGRICSSMRVDSNRMTQFNLAPRCQFWFKLGDTYYLSDSDSDRYAKTLPRKLK